MSPKFYYISNFCPIFTYSINIQVVLILQVVLKLCFTILYNMCNSLKFVCVTFIPPNECVRMQGPFNYNCT